MGNSGSVSEQEAAETKEALKIMREFKQEVRDWVIRMEPHIDLCIDGVAEFKRKTQNDLEQLQTALRELQQQKNVTASQKIMEVQADLGETKETGGHKNVENKGDGSRFIKSA